MHPEVAWKRILLMLEWRKVTMLGAHLLPSSSSPLLCTPHMPVQPWHRTPDMLPQLHTPLYPNLVHLSINNFNRKVFLIRIFFYGSKETIYCHLTLTQQSSAQHAVCKSEDKAAIKQRCCYIWELPVLYLRQLHFCFKSLTLHTWKQWHFSRLGFTGSNQDQAFMMVAVCQSHIA